MLRHKQIDRVCIVVVVLMLLVTTLFTAGAATGVIRQDNTMGYEDRLFDQSVVHTIDILMADWDAFLDTATSEEYAACTMVIDGEKYGNVAIRGKGNTSLSSVAAYGNDRYSFKVEFDHYQSGMTYHGLDKLSLNNIIQDTTYMKDYWAYTLMNRMGVAAPLCSFVQINVGGEPWGLYLAVEGVEDSFLTRNYGTDHGELYKPDSMSFGGGRGNGRDFDFDEVKEKAGWDDTGAETEQQNSGFPGGFTMPDMGGMPQMPGGDAGFGSSGGQSSTPAMPEDEAADGQTFTPPEGFTMPADGGMPQMPEGMEMPDMGGRGGFGGFGMGSSDVQLIYSDDDPASYQNIFGNAKTDISGADQTRLIAALKAVNKGDTFAVDTEAVIRYLTVHNYLCNDDSYTGMMVHNYYLYEEDGVLSMIPWDYNLAMGGFTGGSNATSTVNGDISRPVSGGSTDSRPMVAWIFDGGEYEQQYYDLYQSFMDEVFTSGWFEREYDRVASMIDPYVQQDTNGFYSYEEWQTASATLREFCLLRARSIQNQLSGSKEQVDASHLSLSVMGGMNTGRGGFGGPGGENPFDRGGSTERRNRSGVAASAAPSATPAPTATPVPTSVPVTDGSGASSGMPAGGTVPAAPPADVGGSSGQPAGMPEDFAASDGSGASSAVPAVSSAAPTATPAPTTMPTAVKDAARPAATVRAPLAESTGNAPTWEMLDRDFRNDQMESGNERLILLSCSLLLLVSGLIVAGCFKSKLQ